MSFDEFKDMMAAFADDTPSGAVQKLAALLESGCSETDAKRWIVEHVSEFPASMRDGIMRGVAEDILLHGEESPFADGLVTGRFKEMWHHSGFLEATEWVKEQRRKRRSRNP
jgi:hypothetical protein